MEEQTAYAPFAVDQHLTAKGNYWAGKMGSRFYVALRDWKKILGTPCPTCKTVFWPPRSVCTFCFTALKDTIEIGPLGTVETFTLVTYAEPIHPRPAPFIYAVIRLDGATTGMAHFLDEVDSEEVCIGMRVRPVFAEDRKGNILDIRYFKPL